MRFKLLKPALLLLPLSMVLYTALPSAAQDTKAANAMFDRVQKLITQYYPQANFTRDNHAGTFEGRFNTRTWMIHHPLKTGEYQDARPQEGPKRKGILCRISCGQGHYNGAAKVPQTFDYRYFKSLLRAPYNKRLGTHLIAHLDYPDDVSPEFLQQYSKLIDSF